MRLTSTTLALSCLALITGCRETATCPQGQYYAADVRACMSGAPPDSGADAQVDSGTDAGAPCGGACVDDEHCDVNTGECLECLDASECMDSERPLCLDNTCSMCTGSAQCAALDSTRPNCASTGACEACTAANEVELCGAGRTCDIPSGACVDVVPGAVGICEECGSDLQCGMGLFCIPMRFGMPTPAPRDQAFCLPPLGSPLCTAPFASRLDDRASLSGAAATLDYCGPSEMLTTCEAVLALQESRACPDGTPVVCGEGALCDSVGALPGTNCTYACGVVADCPAGLTCGGTPRRCGG